MHHTLALVIAFCTIGLTADLVRADKAREVAAVKTPPSKMPREKALIVENANLRRDNLTLTVQKLQEQISVAETEVNKLIAERDAILKEYDALGDNAKVDSKTGAITRAPAPPSTDKPEKTAKVEKK